MRKRSYKALTVTSVPRVITLVLKHALSGASPAVADLPVEDDLDGVRAAEVQVVGYQGIEKPRA